jgi:NAD(P)H-hydrate epimerase
MNIADVNTVRSLDKITIDTGTPGLTLMERAGEGLFEAALELIKGLNSPSVLVVCGKGNNGGDGFVVARKLSETGIAVTCVLLSGENTYQGDALTNLEQLKSTPVKIIPGTRSAQRPAFKDFDLIIDAIFGTGFSGAIQGAWRKCIEAINTSGARVLAVDTPSGINSDTGEVEDIAVMAHMTVTMGLPKLGQCFYPGHAHVGDLRVQDIGYLKKDIQNNAGQVSMINREIAGRGILPRKGDEHKNQCGRVLLVAGSTGMTGAACLAARAALKSGAGIVTLCIPESLNPILETKLTEEMTYPLADSGRGTLGKANAREILELAKTFDVLVLGPGISQHRGTQTLVRDLVKRSPVPVVLDADGINAFNGQSGTLKKKKNPVVITPHEGEFKRLTGIKDLGKGPEKIRCLLDVQKKLGVGIVLKGAPTLISLSPDKAYINTSGNPGMATAGAGDVLTGLIGGFYAQTKDFPAACVTGVFIHGVAGDAAAVELGENFLTAHNIIDFLPRAFKEITG